jgi:Protein of unknwon function (DUF3310)
MRRTRAAPDPRVLGASEGPTPLVVCGECGQRHPAAASCPHSPQEGPELRRIEFCHHSLPRATCERCRPDRVLASVHPPHYNKGTVELWDLIEDQSLTEAAAFLKWTVIKHAFRAGAKGDVLTDVRKAEQYAKRWRELLERQARGEQLRFDQAIRRKDGDADTD